MGGLAKTEVMVPSDLWNRVKHPECVERIVAELSDGKEVDAEYTRPDGLVAYRIEYKQGPCREGCSSLLPEIQKKGCYAGRVDRVELSDL
jgi:hypothetical protein